MPKENAALYMMIFTPCFSLLAGIFIGIIAASSSYIDEKEFYCKPIPEIMEGAKVCKPR